MGRFLVFSKAFSLRMVRVTFVLFTFLLLFGLSAAPLVHAQTLSSEKTWGGPSYDEGHGVAVDGSGNTYVAGDTYSFGAGDYDVVLLKYSSSGTLRWQRTWGGTGTDSGQGVAVDGMGNVYVTGYTNSFGAGDYDVVLLKFNATGSLVWQKTWGNSTVDKGYGVAFDYNFNAVYVTGYTNSFGAGNSDVVLLEFNGYDGSLLSQRTWGGTVDDEGLGVAVDGYGNVYVTGTTASFGAGDYDIVLLEFDWEGNLLLAGETWGGTGYDEGRGVAVDGSGKVYVTGTTYSFGAGSADVVLLKFNGVDGALWWQRTWGGTGDDEGLGVAVDGSGNIYVTGGTNSFYPDDGVVLLRYDSTGNLLWQKTWGGLQYDWGYGVTAHAGYVYFTGITDDDYPTLNTVSGNITTPSTPPYGHVCDPGTPTLALGDPTLTPGTPSGSETYVDYGDIFLLRFSTAVVADIGYFAGAPTNSTLLVVGDLALNPTGHGKPSGVGYQQGRDTTPLGFVYGMMGNVQDTMFDTNAAINATTGRPLSSISQTWVFGIGGPGINAVTHYYESTAVVADMAPVKFGYNSTHFYWVFTGNGTKVPGSEILQSSTAVPPGTSDVFVIQVLGDADGRFVVLLYGTRYTGTWAAAVYFKFVVYWNFTTYTDSYYIVRWTDTNGDCTPNIGDTFTILAQGVP